MEVLLLGAPAVCPWPG